MDIFARSPLQMAGRNVIDCGVAPTPTVGIAVRMHKAAGGIQISASHNPARYNGLKLFGAAGRVLPAEAGRRVLAEYERLADAGTVVAASGIAGAFSEEYSIVFFSGTMTLTVYSTVFVRFSGTITV
jgi:phosphomannomutase